MRRRRAFATGIYALALAIPALAHAQQTQLSPQEGFAGQWSVRTEVVSQRIWTNGRELQRNMLPQMLSDLRRLYPPARWRIAIEGNRPAICILHGDRCEPIPMQDVRYNGGEMSFVWEFAQEIGSLHTESSRRYYLRLDDPRQGSGRMRDITLTVSDAFGEHRYVREFNVTMTRLREGAQPSPRRRGQDDFPEIEDEPEAEALPRAPQARPVPRRQETAPEEGDMQAVPDSRPAPRRRSPAPEPDTNYVD